MFFEKKYQGLIIDFLRFFFNILEVVIEDDNTRKAFFYGLLKKITF